MTQTRFASVKFSAEFVDLARQEAALLHRSVAAQIEHWATLGRAMEQTPGVTLDKVRAALLGHFSVDDLNEQEQDAFFDLLGEQFHKTSAVEQAFFAGRRNKGGGVGLDERGNLARTRPGGQSVKISDQA